MLCSPAEETLSPLLPVNSSQQQYCITIEGDVLLAGDSWRANACTSCACNNGTIQCFSQRCPAVNCRVPVLRKGQCCPHCLGEFCGPQKEKATQKLSKKFNTRTYYTSTIKYFIRVLTLMKKFGFKMPSKTGNSSQYGLFVGPDQRGAARPRTLHVTHSHRPVEAANIPRASAHSHVFPVAGCNAFACSSTGRQSSPSAIPIEENPGIALYCSPCGCFT